MSKRIDAHRPSAINPAEYSFVAVECMGDMQDLGDALFMQEQRKLIRAHMERTGGGYSRHAHGGVCHICGNANAIFTALFHHQPTNSYIRVGRDCTEKMGSGSSEIDLFRRMVSDVREAKAGKAKAKALLEDHGVATAWAVWEAPDDSSWAEATTYDIVGKLIRYGDLSEKQWAFLAKLVKQIEEAPAIAAARQAEQDAAKPVPVSDKRIRVEGEVVGVKSVPNPYDYNGGSTIKIIVKHADGWKVYGTAPSKLLDVPIKGCTVAFDAVVEPSHDDPKFGFFSRPTKAELIKEPA